jgi:Ribbon-helix-helix protein, copG family
MVPPRTVPVGAIRSGGVGGVAAPARPAAGYDVEETLRRRGGRPPLGSGPAGVESVRLDPELRRALSERAERDRESTSSVIRKALRNYLEAG